MRYSKRIDSFIEEEERFFGSYEAEQVSAQGPLTLEFETAEAQAPCAEQLAHLSRFRRPVAWVMAAMGLLSLVALGQGLQQNSRREVVSHIRAAAAVPPATRTAEAPWSWTEFVESECERATAFLFEPTLPRASNGERLLPDDAARQASLVNDFTSALLSMCRDVPT